MVDLSHMQLLLFVMWDYLLCSFGQGTKSLKEALVSVFGIKEYSTIKTSKFESLLFVILAIEQLNAQVLVL